MIKEAVDHNRGANALYDSVDAVFLTVIATIGGARALTGVSTIWADGVLRKLAGWVAIPDNSTLGRLFRTFRECQISQLETLNHRLRRKYWRKALRRGVSTIAMGSCRVIDVDSTVKDLTEYFLLLYQPLKGLLRYTPLQISQIHWRQDVSSVPRFLFCVVP